MSTRRPHGGACKGLIFMRRFMRLRRRLDRHLGPRLSRLGSVGCNNDITWSICAGWNAVPRRFFKTWCCGWGVGDLMSVSRAASKALHADARLDSTGTAIAGHLLYVKLRLGAGRRLIMLRVELREMWEQKIYATPRSSRHRSTMLCHCYSRLNSRLRRGPRCRSRRRRSCVFYMNILHKHVKGVQR